MSGIIAEKFVDVVGDKRTSFLVRKNSEPTAKALRSRQNKNLKQMRSISNSEAVFFWQQNEFITNSLA